jgi:hypothetical protein
MFAKLSLAAGLVLAAATLVPVGASAAAPQSPLSGVIAADGSLVQKTQWRYCGGWRRECAARWGWRTPGFFRCMGRHGC